MTKRQFDALRRILDRETADYQLRSGRPAPGQHESEDKVAISDGNICVLLNSLSPKLPVGERTDTFAKIMRNERECGGHLPVPSEQIDIAYWRELAKQWDEQADISGVEFSVPRGALQLSADSSVPGASIPIDSKNPIIGRFDPQLLVDAAEAVGSDPQFFLGMGRFNAHFPSLLVFPPNWMERGGADPIALLLPLRR